MEKDVFRRLALSILQETVNQNVPAGPSSGPVSYLEAIPGHPIEEGGQKLFLLGHSATGLLLFRLANFAR